MKAEIERLARLDSPIHRWDARWKLVAFFVFMLSVATLNRPGIALLAAGFALTILLPCGFPWRLVFHRLVVVHFFLVPCVVILLFTVPGDPIEVGFFTLSRHAITLSAALYLRVVAIVLVSIALIYSTPMNTLLRAAERLWVPSVLIQIAMMTYRYLFTLGWELDRIRIALTVRGFRYKTSSHTYRTLANVVGVTLVHSLERADRVYRAMQCRGYSGKLPAWNGLKTTLGDVVKFSCCVLLTVLLLWLDD